MKREDKKKSNSENGIGRVPRQAPPIIICASLLVYQGMNCKFFCTSLYCNTAKGYNSNSCKLTIHSPEHEYS